MDSLEEVEEALDRLLGVAEQLVEASQQIVSKEVLRPLQEEQEKMIAALERVEKEFQEQCSNRKDEGGLIKKRIADKLAGFQKLNERFIKNITAYRKLIDL